jgi:glycosyltransferase involved in cell wall biosynthesis
MNTSGFSFITMSQPFFSIVIPTKNRPELLGDTISSVLLQDFDDYELIISDNVNDARTKNVIDKFRNDRHVTCICTEKELSMPDHFEFATKKVKGIYTLILTDRSFLRQGALRDIYDSIKKSSRDVAVCFWAYDYYDEVSKLWRGQNEKAENSILKSEDIVKNFAKTLNARFLPRPHTGCYRFDVAEKIRQKIGRLFLPFAPDNVSALIFSAFADEVLYVPRSLVLFQGNKVGNVIKDKMSPWPYFNSLNIKDPYKFVPIKAPIISNLVFNDFLMVKDLVGGVLKDANIDWIFYFTLCYEEVMIKMTMRGMDKKIQSELLKEWRKAFSRLDKKSQKAIKIGIIRKYPNIFKSFLAESFLGGSLIRIKRAMQNKPTLKFEDALSAGGFVK